MLNLILRRQNLEIAIFFGISSLYILGLSRPNKTRYLNFAQDLGSSLNGTGTGRGPRPRRTAAMEEHDPLVLSYSHLRDFPREKEALHTVKKVASLVKPIMRARGWTVGELAEFYPDQQNLLGRLKLGLNAYRHVY